MKKLLVLILLTAPSAALAASAAAQSIPYLFMGLVGPILFSNNSMDKYVALDSGKINYQHALGSNAQANFNQASVLRLAYGVKHDNIAFEANYSQFGDAVINGALGRDVLSGSAMQLVVIADFPITASFEVSPKLGLVNSKHKFSSSVPGQIERNGSNSGFVYGLGAQYRFDKNIALRMQYDNLGELSRSANPPKAATVSLGLIYGF